MTVVNRDDLKIETKRSLDSVQVSLNPNTLPFHVLIELKVQKASTALLKHITKSQDVPSKNLLPPSSQPIHLIITAKKNYTKRDTLKPTKIPVPHTFYPLSTSDLAAAADISICLITTDPHASFKDLIRDPAFPDKDLQKHIKRIIGIKKLKERYKSYESRRQLLAEHDVFLADDRAITLLPKILGKVFYSSTTKRPIPVVLTPPRAGKPPSSSSNNNKFSVIKRKLHIQDSDRSIASPSTLASEIRKTLSCTTAALAPSPTIAVKVGNSSFAPENLAANISAVVEKMVEKHVPGGWQGLKAVHVKGSETMALPVWLAEELWIDEKHVLEEGERRKVIEGKKGMKRKLLRVEEDEQQVDALEGGSNAVKEKKQKKKKRGLDKEDEMSKEMRERREKLRRQLKGEKEKINEAVAVEL